MPNAEEALDYNIYPWALGDGMKNTATQTCTEMSENVTSVFQQLHFTDTVLLHSAVQMRASITQGISFLPLVHTGLWWYKDRNTTTATLPEISKMKSRGKKKSGPVAKVLAWRYVCVLLAMGKEGGAIIGGSMGETPHPHSVKSEFSRQVKTLT